MQTSTRTRRRQRGFTLTELLIALAILTILASIAIPSYRDSVRRSHRTDAAGSLMALAAMQEKFHLQNNTYTTVLGDGGLAWDHEDTGTFYSYDGFYTVSVIAADADGFQIQAAADGGQARDNDCKVLTIDEQGRRGARNDADEDTSELCWG